MVWFGLWRNNFVLSPTCWPPIASGTLPGRLLCEDESGEGAVGRLCPDAEAELSPVHDGDKFEPDPVEPGDVAGAPVSWKKTNVRDFDDFYYLVY